MPKVTDYEDYSKMDNPDIHGIRTALHYSVDPITGHRVMNIYEDDGKGNGLCLISIDFSEEHEHVEDDGSEAIDEMIAQGERDIDESFYGERQGKGNDAMNGYICFYKGKKREDY